MGEVVKCGECRQYFMYSAVDKVCPFCHVAYRAVEEEVVEEKAVEKKEVTKMHKKSLKT